MQIRGNGKRERPESTSVGYGDEKCELMRGKGGKWEERGEKERDDDERGWREV